MLVRLSLATGTGPPRRIIGAQVARQPENLYSSLKITRFYGKLHKRNPAHNMPVGRGMARKRHFSKQHTSEFDIQTYDGDIWISITDQALSHDQDFAGDEWPTTLSQATRMMNKLRARGYRHRRIVRTTVVAGGREF